MVASMQDQTPSSHCPERATAGVTFPPATWRRPCHGRVLSGWPAATCVSGWRSQPGRSAGDDSLHRPRRWFPGWTHTTCTGPKPGSGPRPSTSVETCSTTFTWSVETCRCTWSTLHLRLPRPHLKSDGWWQTGLLPNYPDAPHDLTGQELGTSWPTFRRPHVRSRAQSDAWLSATRKLQEQAHP